MPSRSHTLKLPFEMRSDQGSLVQLFSLTFQSKSFQLGISELLGNLGLGGTWASTPQIRVCTFQGVRLFFLYTKMQPSEGASSRALISDGR